MDLSAETPISNQQTAISQIDDKKLSNLPICPTCNKTFSKKSNLTRHAMIHSGVKPFICNVCQKSFSRPDDLKKHLIIHEKIPTEYGCEQCSESFNRKYELLNHIRKNHKKTLSMHVCDVCSEIFRWKYELLKHMRKNHQKPPPQHELPDSIRKNHRKSSPQHFCEKCSEVFKYKKDLRHHTLDKHRSPLVQVQITNSSDQDLLREKTKHFKRQNALNVFTTTTFDNKNNDIDLLSFFNNLKTDILNELNFQLNEKRALKWHTIVKVKLTRTVQEGPQEFFSPFFRSNTFTSFSSISIDNDLEKAFAKMIKSFEEFNEQGSDWTLEEIIELELHMAKFTPFSSSKN